MTEEPSASLLIDELQAILGGLRQARRMLGKDSLPDSSDLWQRIETCANRLSRLEREERDPIKPTILALLDEVQQSISAFEAERCDLAERLKSTHRNKAADTAYRQAEAR